ncbi:carbon-nitrogen family hydrolase [Oceanobacillus sp. AG]|uniref:carbon-nitrogen family hydrolase n=1 Tax=Oceanobacillus sp. AG TaxID=2681969 RepID=UPI003519EEC8
MMKVAVYQMELVPGSPHDNREKVKHWVGSEVKNDKPDIILLPEMWTTSYVLEELQTIADDALEPTKSFLSELAKEYKINIVGGSIANKVDDKLYNTSLVFDRAGNLVYEYSKMHLVPMLNEPAYLTGGKEKVQTFELDGIRMGVIICYDLRFPELTRKLALDGAQVLFIPAEWPKPRTNHWVNLQIARAIENQMYVVSANNVGTLNEVKYTGTSLIADPWGDVLVKGSEDKEETLRGTINPDRVIEVRKSVPIFESRVPELY